jgi:hypothetical protein
VSKRLAALFSLALVGVLFMLAVLVTRTAGPFAAVVVLGLVLVPIVVAIVRARARQLRLVAGRTCTCCTGTVHDPVKVV